MRPVHEDQGNSWTGVVQMFFGGLDLRDNDIKDRRISLLLPLTSSFSSKFASYTTRKRYTRCRIAIMNFSNVSSYFFFFFYFFLFAHAAAAPGTAEKKDCTSLCSAVPLGCPRNYVRDAFSHRSAYISKYVAPFRLLTVMLNNRNQFLTRAGYELLCLALLNCRL